MLEWSSLLGGILAGLAATGIAGLSRLLLERYRRTHVPLAIEYDPAHDAWSSGSRFTFRLSVYNQTSAVVSFSVSVQSPEEFEVEFGEHPMQRLGNADRISNTGIRLAPHEGGQFYMDGSSGRTGSLTFRLGVSAYVGGSRRPVALPQPEATVVISS